MNDDLDYYRRRAAEEAASARNAGSHAAASIHRALSTAYLRRLDEMDAPELAPQAATSF